MKTFKIILLSFVFIFLFYCASAKSPEKVKSVSKLKSIALVNMKILPFAKPMFPLIDAGAFKKRVNPLASEIMEEEKKRVDIY